MTCPIHLGQPDLSRRQVRARRRVHLEALKARSVTLTELGRHDPDQVQIVETFYADYRFRIVLPADLWARVLAELDQEMDYSNFKDQIHDQPDYCQSCLRVWGEMRNFQDKARPLRR